MAIDYVKMRALAERLIAENGADCTFVRNSRTPVDTSKPWRAPITDPSDPDDPPVSVVARAVVVPTNEDDDDDAMRRGDAVAYVAADTFGAGMPFVEAAMDGFDFMTDAFNLVWRVAKVQTIAPGPLRVVYQIILLH